MLAHGLVVACFVPHVYEADRRAEFAKPIEQREKPRSVSCGRRMRRRRCDGEHAQSTKRKELHLLGQKGERVRQSSRGHEVTVNDDRTNSTPISAIVGSTMLR